MGMDLAEAALRIEQELGRNASPAYTLLRVRQELAAPGYGGPNPEFRQACRVVAAELFAARIRHDEEN
jgi:hypothetical protein